MYFSGQIKKKKKKLVVKSRQQLLSTGIPGRHVGLEFEIGLFIALLESTHLQSGLGREHKTTGLRLEERSFHSENGMRQETCKQQVE